MIKIKDIVSEMIYSSYRIFIRVAYSEDISVTDAEEMVRSIKGITTVTVGDTEKSRSRTVFQIKFLTEKEPKEALKEMKKEALQMEGILTFEIGGKTLEKLS